MIWLFLNTKSLILYPSAKKLRTEVSVREKQGLSLTAIVKLSRAVNELVKNLNNEEITIILGNFEEIVDQLREKIQSTISFKQFWNHDDKLNNIMSSLMSLVRNSNAS